MTDMRLDLCKLEREIGTIDRVISIVGSKFDVHTDHLDRISRNLLQQLSPKRVGKYSCCQLSLERKHIQ